MDGSVTPTRAATLSVLSKADQALVPGRRKFFRYRDLGVAAATGGRIRAQIMEAITGMTEPTGWHIHECEAQFVYVLKGWVELEFEDGSRHRCESGAAVLIPGGMKHNEIATSDDVEILELSVPGPMATHTCEPPAGMG